MTIAAEIPTPVLPPAILHEGRGAPIEIRGGVLQSPAGQLAFLGALMAAIRLNLEEEARTKLCSTQFSAPA